MSRRGRVIPFKERVAGSSPALRVSTGSSVGRAATVRLQFLLTFLLSTSCFDDEILYSTKCGSVCYTGPSHTRNIGSCRTGRTICDQTGAVLSCDGEITPQAEFCAERVDTNCDGLLGFDLADAEYGATCGSDVGRCVRGQWRCIDGAYECLGGIEPVAEDCSGRDLDCDGVANNIALQICYSGDPLELLPPLSDCRAGILQCVSGAPTCVGEQLPTHEICGAERDRNCNGILDDLPGSAITDAVDVVILLDRSGSMASKHDAVVGALLTFVERHAATQFRYSLVEVPGDTYSQVSVLWPEFVDASQMRQALQMLTGYHGGYEHSWDAIERTANGTYGHQYRVAARKIIMWFGDEAGQTMEITVPRAERLARVEQALLASGAQLLAFIDLRFASDYEPLTYASGGLMDSIELDTLSYSILLNSVIGSCVAAEMGN